MSAPCARRCRSDNDPRSAGQNDIAIGEPGASVTLRRSARADRAWLVSSARKLANACQAHSHGCCFGFDCNELEGAMPRRQRFKPSRKPKPAIELNEAEIVHSNQPTNEPPPTNQEQREAAEERDPH
jgi:hypothetical protein